MNFNIGEQDVLRVREEIRRANHPEELKKVPVEIGLQTEDGYPHKGTLDYAAPVVSQSTGTLAVRAILQKSKPGAAAGIFRPRARSASSRRTRCSCPIWRWAADQAGRYVLVVNKDNVVEQRKVVLGSARRRAARDREWADAR